MKLNDNYELREKIIFNEKIDWNTDRNFGGMMRFDNLDLCRLIQLFSGNFINPDDDQNGSPTAKEFLNFMLRWRDYPITAHGYVISPNRADYRTTIEGLNLNYTEISHELREEFYKYFTAADEFCAQDNRLYCWYD